MSAAPKFTPGPWGVERDGFTLYMRDQVVATAIAPDGADTSEQRANARLIASAPDLFAALSYLVARHLGEGTEQPSASAWDVGWQKARAALLKAAR